MCKAGAIPDIEVAPGILTPTANNNSSSESSYVKDSINTVVNVTITSGAALLVGIIILLVAVYCLHKLLKSSHKIHAQRINTLASLTGFGHEHLKKEEEYQEASV